MVPEPVDKWQCIGENGVNVLDAFYRDPERYAYTFQNYVFVTRVMQVLPPDVLLCLRTFCWIHWISRSLCFPGL